MTFGKLALAAVALVASIGMSGTASQAAPFSPIPALSEPAGIVQAQYRPGRRVAPPRRVCRWETETRRVRGRIIRERVQRCTMVRR
jgi:hypothetical protein